MNYETFVVVPEGVSSKIIKIKTDRSYVMHFVMDKCKSSQIAEEGRKYRSGNASTLLFTYVKLLCTTI